MVKGEVRWVGRLGGSLGAFLGVCSFRPRFSRNLKAGIIVRYRLTLVLFVVIGISA